jgi:hypothetical protein
MHYADTVVVAQLTNKFYVECGIGCRVGEKHNYFRVDDPRSMTKKEADAVKLLGFNVFPKEDNEFDTEAEAKDYARRFKNYVNAVVALPSNLKVGHSCEFWK